jgi:hypothetical protein
LNAVISEDCSVFLSTIDSSTRARLGGHSDYLRMDVQVIGAPVNMYQKYQPCPPRVVSFWNCFLGEEELGLLNLWAIGGHTAWLKAEEQHFLRLPLFGRPGTRVQRALVQARSMNDFFSLAATFLLNG